MINHTIEFRRTPEEAVLLAAYVSELIRQGVTFTIRQDDSSVAVELTGGF